MRETRRCLASSEKARVTEMVRSVAGVRDVANGLQVDPDAAKTLKQKVQDKLK